MLGGGLTGYNHAYMIVLHTTLDSLPVPFIQFAVSLEAVTISSDICGRSTGSERGWRMGAYCWALARCALELDWQLPIEADCCAEPLR